MDNYIVEMENISKAFGGVQALKDVNFHLRSGEVMALLGENGAGKSTLVKILSGVYQCDSGTITVEGKQFSSLNTKTAQELGIAIIHQELSMCPHLSVAENIFLGREHRKGVLLNNKTMNLETRKILDYLGIKLDPGIIVGTLPVAKQQMVEIAKALSQNARVLIMDEPTSSLSVKEIDELFRIIQRLRSEGCGIVYISHRLEELRHVADRVTILRDGRFILEGDYSDFSIDSIISNMVGRDISDKYPKVSCERGEVVFDVKGLQSGARVRNVSFQVYAGEILGIAGLVGAGRTETTRAIFGIDPKDGGEIAINGQAASISSPKDAIKAGLILVPEDRKRDGLCMNLSIRENIGLPNEDLISNQYKKIDNRKEREITNKAISDLSIKAAGIEARADSLSGGNQQKVVIGKWLARDAKVVMFDEPTRGVDVGAKVEIYNIMNELKKQGVAVLFVSSELPEILGVSDRILVMCDGRVTGDIMADEATEDIIMAYATKFESKF